MKRRKYFSKLLKFIKKSGKNKQDLSFQQKNKKVRRLF